jgi:drug/metabolite transporter (DMT)-like permease
VFAGVVMVTVAAASWGTWSLFLRASDVPAEVASPIVFAVMALASLPIALRGDKVRWDRTTVWLLVGNALFDASNLITFFAAINATTVAIAVLSHYVAPIIIALAAPRVDGVRVRWAGPAAVFALAGLVVVLEPWRELDRGAIAGAALGVVSAFCYTGNVFVVRRIAERIGAVRAMSYHAAIAAVLVLPFALRNLGAITPHGVAYLAAGATTIGACSGVLFTLGLRRIGSARAGILAFAEPLVAVAVGALVWAEPLHPLAAVGGAMIIAAGIVVARGARSPEPRYA